MQSSGKQFLCGQKEQYKVEMQLESDWIMFVNEWMGLYTKSDVYNKRLSEIRAKSIKCKLKQQIIKGVR